MNYLITLIVLSAVTYRVSRFIVLDKLIAFQRYRVLTWMEFRPRFQSFWSKIVELLTCPYCTTIWVAAGAVVAQRVFVGPVPVPVWTWLGAATGALVFWAIVDSEESDDSYGDNPRTD